MYNVHMHTYTHVLNTRCLISANLYIYMSYLLYTCTWCTCASDVHVYICVFAYLVGSSCGEEGRVQPSVWHMGCWDYCSGVSRDTTANVWSTSNEVRNLHAGRCKCMHMYVWGTSLVKDTSVGLKLVHTTLWNKDTSHIVPLPSPPLLLSFPLPLS